MKRYYLLRQTEVNQIGDVDGIQCGFEDNIETDFFLKLSNYEPYPKNVIDIFRLDSRAKVTDYLSIGAKNNKGMLISQKMYEVIKKFNIPYAKPIQAKVNYDDRYLEYIWLDFYTDFTHKIDYKKTTFHIKTIGFIADKYEDLKIENKRDTLIEFDKKIAGSRMSIVPKTKYYFNEEIDQIDILRIGHFDERFYFSEQLRFEIFRNNLTGFDLLESVSF